MYLRQSTAGQEILLGPFLDSTDGNTAETGLTIANTDIKLHKHGATTEANKNSGGATHIAGGRYYAVLDATDTNTLGNLEVNVHVAGALAVRRQYVIMPAVVFDALVLGTDNLVVDLLQTAADKVWGTTTRILTANTNFNDPNLADIVDAVWDEALAGHSTAGTTGLKLSSIVADPWAIAVPGAYGAGTAGLVLGNGLSVTNTTIDTKVDAVKDKTDLIPASPAAVSDIPTAIQIRTEVDSNSTQLAAIKAKTDALPASPAATGDIPSAGANADAVWDEVRTGHTTAGTFGLFLDAQVSTRTTGTMLTATAVRTEIDSNSTQLAAIKAKTDNLPASPAAVSDIPTAVQIRTEIDTNSTELAAIDGKLPATLSSGRIRAAVEALGTSTAALDNLRDHALRAVPVTFTGGTTTTAVLGNVDGAAASSTDDVYNGRVFIFSAPAGLKDQACAITDYVGSTKTATISAVTTAVTASSAAVMV